MKSLLLRKVFRRVRSVLGPDPDAFLRVAIGVIHVGANDGQERELYDRYGLHVLWIEPIPEVFAVLKENLLSFPRQDAIQALVTDQDGSEYKFHIASNQGASSSIFDFKDHVDVWPEITYDKTISMRSRSLASLLSSEGIEASRYDSLVIDTQGSELLVLQGALPMLHNFRFVKLEVADFEAYEGGCQLIDVERFMKRHGYVAEIRRPFAEHPDRGSYYDVVYRRMTSPKES